MHKSNATFFFFLSHFSPKLKLEKYQFLAIGDLLMRTPSIKEKLTTLTRSHFIYSSDHLSLHIFLAWFGFFPLNQWYLFHQKKKRSNNILGMVDEEPHITVTDIFFLGKMHVNHCQQNKDKTFMTPDSWYATLWKSSK